MKNIGIEKGLTSVKNYLNQRGYMASEIDFTHKNDPSFIKNLDAIVLTGIDDNFLGVQNVTTNIPIIEATGLSPEEIVNLIERQ
ncbi:MAG: YkuS family protein [Ignavibacteriales bacterium]